MHSWLEKIAAKRVLVIGDVMLDRYYFADVTRISPEGPVPEMKPLEGWHVNVRHGEEAPELEQYRVEPKAPQRMWA